jgi:hypothetical protein
VDEVDWERIVAAPDRVVIRSLLQRWRSNEIDEREVHEEAERLLDEHGWIEYPENDDRSVVMEVLSQLAILNLQLVTREDIPAMLGFLDTPPGEASKAWQPWRRYWNSLDYEKRREELKQNPYYST